MTPAFTILLPHKRNPKNDEALDICLDCLMRHTVSDFKLVMHAHQDEVLFEVMNDLVAQAPTDRCIFMHSDMFVTQGWDVAMLAVFDEMTFVTGLLVEPGAIGVHHRNIQHDFGRKPSTFRRAEFEQWAASNQVPRASGEGWYAPYLFSRQRWWLDMGGHDLSEEHHRSPWSPRDIDLFDKHKASGGRVVQAQAVVYHLQRWSEIEEQEAAKRG